MRNTVLFVFSSLACALFWQCQQTTTITGPGIEYRLRVDASGDTGITNECAHVLAMRLLELNIPNENFDVRVDSGVVIVRIKKDAIEDEAQFEHVLLDRGEMTFCETYHFEELAPYIRQMDSVYCKVNNIQRDSILGVPVLTPVQQFLISGFQDSAVYVEGRYAGERFPVLYYCRINDTAEAKKILNHDSIKALFPDNLKWTWAFDQSVGYHEERVGVIAVRSSRGSCLPIEGITSAEYYHGEQGFASVDVAFDDVTKNNVNRCIQNNINRSVAIAVNGFIYDYFFATQSTSSGGITIGEVDILSSHLLAAILAGGVMPAKVSQLSKSEF